MDLHTKSGIPFNQITVLTPRSLTELSVLGDLLQKPFPGGFRLVDPFSKNPQMKKETRGTEDVAVSSIHHFKGLETPVGIVVELDQEFLEQKNWRELCYVGFSRAKTMLFILGQRQALQKMLMDDVPESY